MSSSTTSHLIKFLQPDEEHQLLLKAEKITLKKNEVVITEAEENKGVYLTASGLIKVFRCQKNGMFILGLAGKGDFIGLDSALFGTQNKTTCIVAQDATLYFIPRAALQEALQSNPSLFIKLMGYLSEKVNQLESRICNVTHKKVLNHFAELIYNLSSASYKTIIVPNILSINEIADLIGTTKFYVYKLIQKLEDKNAISFSDRKLKVTNKEALRLLTVQT